MVCKIYYTHYKRDYLAQFTLIDFPDLNSICSTQIFAT